MASPRIRTGFHRLAIVLSVVFLIPGIGVLVWPGGDTDAAAALFAIAAFFYVATRAIGWIVEGFSR